MRRTTVKIRSLVRIKLRDKRRKSSVFKRIHSSIDCAISLIFEPIFLTPSTVLSTTVSAVHYDGFKEHMHNQISRFLLKIVPEETVSKVLTDTLFKKIYKLLGIK